MALSLECPSAIRFTTWALVQEQLRGGLVANGVPSQEFGDQVVDDGADHAIEVGNLVVQLKIAPSERPERDSVG